MIWHACVENVFRAEKNAIKTCGVTHLEVAGRGDTNLFFVYHTKLYQQIEWVDIHSILILSIQK